MKNKDLDFYLKKAIELQKRLWHKEDTGIGAACLLIPSSGEAIYDVCRDIGHNNFAHAEHNVIHTYIKRHGQPPPAEAILITTISPCSNPNSSWRVGDSCSALVEKYGIKHVYTGVYNHTDARPTDFDLAVTKNEQLAQTCKNLHSLFNIKAPRQADGSLGRLVTSYKNDVTFSRVFKAGPS